jgi:low affinity Fe/Cu permease
VKKKLKNLALFLEQLRSHFICIEYVQIDNVEEQRKIKEDLIQNTEEVEKVLAIREEMDAKQELNSFWTMERLPIKMFSNCWG